MGRARKSDNKIGRRIIFLMALGFIGCTESDDSPENRPADTGFVSMPMDAAEVVDAAESRDAMLEPSDSGLQLDAGEWPDAGESADAGFPMNEDAAEQQADTGPSSVCGDGVLEAAETCDDGNVIDEDGCSSSCQIEPQCTAGCLMNSDCMGAEQCIGQPRSVMGATGQCNDTTFVMGREAPCSQTMACGPGLVCLGEFAYMSGGFCVESWFAKDFYSYDDLSIPDNAMTITSSVVACGLATVPVDIVVTLHLDHPRPEDLVVVLKDPSRAKSAVLLNQQAYTPGPIVARGIPGDGSVNGQWYLEVTDMVPGESGRLLGWSVYLLSRWD